MDELAELGDGNGVRMVVAEAVNGGGFEQGIDDGFFGGVYGGFEEWGEGVFGEQGERWGTRGGLSNAVGGGKGDGVVAAAVAGG